MGSNIFGILYTGISGIMASQIAMDVTGDNIANANTDGYSRKRLEQAAVYRRDPQFGAIGYGAHPVKIQRLRDFLLDQHITLLTSDLGYYKQLDEGTSRVEDILVEPDDTALNKFINDFWNSWQDLANNPDDMASRAVVLRTAKSLINKFKTIVGKLRDLQDAFNEEMEYTIKQINEYIGEIYKLNREVVAIETNGQVANDARDRRDFLIKKLAELVDITYYEDDKGAYNVFIDGNLVVSATEKIEIAPTYEYKKRYDNTTQKIIKVQLSTTKKELDIRGGKLRAYMELRDNIINKKLEQLDNLAYNIKERVNELHESGYTLDGLTGIPFFDPKSKGAMDLEIYPTVDQNLRNIAAATGGSSLHGTDTITVPNPPYGVPLEFDTTPRDNLVYDSVVLTNSSNGYVYKEGIDYVVNYQEGTIVLLADSLIPPGAVLNVEYDYRVADFKGEGDGSNALAIAGLREKNTMDANVFGEYTKTFNEFYGSIIGTLGAERQEYKSSRESVESLHLQYVNRQDQIAGVSLDEEMTNLIVYQHAYIASTKVISTVEKMLDALFNM